MSSTLSHDERGQFIRRYFCNSCEMLSINGLPCHETGCPDAWRDAQLNCRWCGERFSPQERHQACCSQDCRESWFG